MAQTKQIKAASPLNNGFGTFKAGDGKELFATDHPTVSGTFSNELTTPADLNETSLEQAMIDIAALTDERGLKIAANAPQTHPTCLLYTSPSPRDGLLSRMPSSA